MLVLYAGLGREKAADYDHRSCILSGAGQVESQVQKNTTFWRSSWLNGDEERVGGGGISTCRSKRSYTIIVATLAQAQLHNTTNLPVQFRKLPAKKGAEMSFGSFVYWGLFILAASWTPVWQRRWLYEILMFCSLSIAVPALHQASVAGPGSGDLLTTGSGIGIRNRHPG